MRRVSRWGAAACAVALAMTVPAAAQRPQPRQVVAVVVGTVDIFDKPMGAPVGRMSRNEIPVPTDVIDERPEGFVLVEARGGRLIWLDSSQVRMNGTQIRCARPAVIGLAPLGTMGAGDSCKR